MDELQQGDRIPVCGLI